MFSWDLSKTNHHILICNGNSCLKEQGEEVTAAIREAITSRGLDEKIHTSKTYCDGRCDDACVVISYPAGTWYQKITPSDTNKLLDHVMDGGEWEKVSHQWKNGVLVRKEGVLVGKSKIE